MEQTRSGSRLRVIILSAVIACTLLLGAGFVAYASGLMGDYVDVTVDVETVEEHGLRDAIVVAFSVPVSLEEAQRGVSLSPSVEGSVEAVRATAVPGYASTYAFVPKDHFEPGVTYTVRVDDVESLAKSRLTPESFTFTTIDYPEITAVVPAHEDVIDIDAPLSLTFDHLSDDFDVSVVLDPPADLRESRQGSTLTYTPETLLLQGQEYEVSVRMAVAGAALEMKQATATVHTRGPVSLVETSPSADQAAASQVAPIMMRFDRAIEQEGFEQHVTIDPEVAGEFVWLDDTTAQFFPEVYLPEATTFTVSLDDQIQARDDAGHVSGGTQFAFTTRKGNGRLVPPPVQAPTRTEGRVVEVDLAQQALYAYEDGELINAFLISSGLPSMPTPAGEFEITRKKPVTTYRWNYGEGDPRNYDLAGVQWNMNLSGSLYWLHGAYWHNNFGYRMSHGCVNIATPDAGWLYEFTEVGTPVRIYY
ncbi:MAG: L,D-transpeptidase [Candidatus Doudnabacteria bacterium]|nr:L,D-transpeptidase [Candidatus Doudnabacteria bacterium]